MVTKVLKIGLGSFVRPKGSMSPDAIGTVQSLDKEDGVDYLTALAPHGESMSGPVTTFEVVSQPRWKIGEYFGVQKVESEVVIEMTKQAKFRVVYGPKGRPTNQWLDELLDLSVARYVAHSLIRILHHRFRQKTL